MNYLNYIPGYYGDGYAYYLALYYSCLLWRKNNENL
jgi:hypothetical protein